MVDGAAHDTWDLDLANDLFLVGLDGRARLPHRPRRGLSHPSPSPDGASIAFLGNDDPMVDPKNPRVGVLDLASRQRRWISHYDRNHAPTRRHLAPIWDDDASSRRPTTGAACRCAASPVGAKAAETRDRRRAVRDRVRLAGHRRLHRDVGDDDGRAVRGRRGEERQLTAFGNAFVERVGLRPYERFTSRSSGGAEVDTWVVTPPDFDPDGSYPALLNIHGGPFTQYGNRFFDEVQLQARAGYMVVFANPRGSSGRETSRGRAIGGPKMRTDPGTGWGSVDFDDLMAVVDEALRRYPLIDAERLGVLGGSYGGYMTSWIVGHTDRFEAACSERAVNNLLTLEATSDIATAFRSQMGVNHLDDPSEYLARSPITFVPRIRTPLLMVHSEDDLRCPIEQAEQLFVALRPLGREVEFVRFPAESHELSRRAHRSTGCSGPRSSSSSSTATSSPRPRTRGRPGRGRRTTLARQSPGPFTKPSPTPHRADTGPHRQTA